MAGKKAQAPAPVFLCTVDKIMPTITLVSFQFVIHLLWSGLSQTRLPQKHEATSIRIFRFIVESSGASGLGGAGEKFLFMYCSSQGCLCMPATLYKNILRWFCSSLPFLLLITLPNSSEFLFWFVFQDKSKVTQQRNLRPFLKPVSWTFLAIEI